MDPHLRQRVEIDTLHEILPELTPYQLLGLRTDAPQEDVDSAYRTEARRLHPDRFAALTDPVTTRKVSAIYRALGEAWGTLRDPIARSTWDARHASEAVVEPTPERVAEDPLLAARTEKGGKYWRMALQNWKDEDFKGCLMQIGFALSFEPDNATFKEWREKVKARAAEDASKVGDRFKIRI